MKCVIFKIIFCEKPTFDSSYKEHNVMILNFGVRRKNFLIKYCIKRNSNKKLRNSIE